MSSDGETVAQAKPASTQERRYWKWAEFVAAILTFLFVLAGPFRTGWRQAETDFPNYYTAAVLLRQGQPLRNYYDWSWFARQMNYAGNGRQLGSYTAQTPLTMLPMLGLTSWPPQRAKQVWLVCDLAFLGLTVWLLSRVTRFNVAEVWLLAFCGFFSLRINFLYGQYYIFLLFLLTLGFCLLHRRKYLLGGVVSGMAFALKLYGGPFLLYFLARREWKALLSMIATTVVLVGVAIALFGSSDVHYYATQMLPRSLEGGSIDPYNPGVPTFSTLLKHLFMREPELNAHPLWNAPGLFFFLRTFVSLAIVACLFLRTSLRETTDKQDFAWFMIAIVLLSTSTASYTFILLLLPVMLLLEELQTRKRILLLTFYVLLTLPLQPEWLFPKVWLLFALFLWVGWPYLRRMPLRTALAVTAVVASAALVDAKYHMLGYADEPAQHFPHAVVQPGAIFSSFPVVSRAGLFYQSIGQDRYELRWLHDHRIEELAFEGEALYPRVAPDGKSIIFELVENRSSTMMQFDPGTAKLSTLTIPVSDQPQDPTVSPDGKWIAIASPQDGPWHIWIRDRSSGREQRLSGGNCNSFSPAWELDSGSVVFASDCGRAFGLPALYRARIADMGDGVGPN